MNNFYKLLFIIILYPLCSQSQENKDSDEIEVINGWYNIGNNRDSSETYYIKLDKEVKLNSEIRIWLKTVFADKKVKQKNGKYTIKKGDYLLVYMIFYCEDKSVDALDYYLYDNNGKVIKDGNLESYGNRIVPDTINEAIYHFVCASLNDE